MDTTTSNGLSRSDDEDNIIVAMPRLGVSPGRGMLSSCLDQQYHRGSKKSQSTYVPNFDTSNHDPSHSLVAKDAVSIASSDSITTNGAGILPDSQETDDTEIFTVISEIRTKTPSSRPIRQAFKREPIIHENVISDSESELSELDATPPPPAFPPQQDMYQLGCNIECVCTAWCTCPKGPSYPNPSPAHLSEKTLHSLAAEAPCSNERSTLEPSHQRVFNPVFRAMFTRGLDVIGSEVALRLSKLSNSGMDSTAANRLVDSINLAFPPSHNLPRATSAIERVHEALTVWEEDRSYLELWASVKRALKGSPDHLVDFQAFFPEELQTMDRQELFGKYWVWERGLQPDVMPFGWKG